MRDPLPEVYAPVRVRVQLTELRAQEVQVCRQHVREQLVPAPVRVRGCTESCCTFGQRNVTTEARATRPELRRDNPLNLSISVNAGKDAALSMAGSVKIPCTARTPYNSLPRHKNDRQRQIGVFRSTEFASRADAAWYSDGSTVCETSVSMK